VIPHLIRLRKLSIRDYKAYFSNTVPNMESIWSMSDEKVRELPEYRKITYEEYLKFALLAQVAIIILPLISTIPDILTNDIWWPLYTQLGISFILSIWILWLSHGIRKANREISVREIMLS
jgi:hypothetical protein